MEKSVRSKKKNQAPSQNVAAEMPAAANMPQNTVGHFSVPELCSGVVKTGSGHIAFEFDFSEPIDPSEVTVDLVVGPSNWHEGAEVFEVKAVPLTGNTAAFEVPEQGEPRHFYGRVHTPHGTHFINRDGRPYENFQL